MKKETLFHNSFWTTLLFIILQCLGLTAFSWWWILATLFIPPVAWIVGIVWLISQVV